MSSKAGRAMAPTRTGGHSDPDWFAMSSKACDRAARTDLEDMGTGFRYSCPPEAGSGVSGGGVVATGGWRLVGPWGRPVSG